LLLASIARVADNSYFIDLGRAPGTIRGAQARRRRPLSFMRPIIRHNPDPLPLALPDFRNLGTILRILLGVNAVVVVAGWLRESRWEHLASEWVELAGMVEPQLLLVLAILTVAQPRIARLPWATGASIVAAVTVATAFLVHAMLEYFAPQPSAALLRRLVFSLLLCIVLLGYFRLRSKALSPAFTEARLQALQARIRPHFLFNSINAVLSLIRAEPARAEEALEDLADLFRVLMRDNRGLTPLGDEVLLCRQYLALEKLRLGDRLQVEWHLNSMPADALVPPLVLQPLLENAVYHGIEPLSGPGVVSINIFYKGGDVHAILRNPYRVDGGSHHAGNKMAIGNVRERLALHFDAEASLESKVSADVYEVHIRMPYRVAEEPAQARRDSIDPAEARRE
jgi:two-component system sensor histidine kinase AlgZ